MEGYHLFSRAVNKKIILFGGGMIADDYMRKYGWIFKPEMIWDNDERKWGREKWGIPVKRPGDGTTGLKNGYFIIICSKYEEEIQIQLDKMQWDAVYTYDPQKDYLADVSALKIPRYHTGYVPGVFDLYHAGHLNLLKRSKERCEFLIAGVLTDELVYHFKKQYPYIPFEDRIAIIESVRYVDKAVPVDFSNTIKMEAWKQLQFDCHFSGDDHLKDWDRPLKELRSVGANMEFFPYTQKTSSTQIRRALVKREL